MLGQPHCSLTPRRTVSRLNPPPWNQLVSSTAKLSPLQPGASSTYMPTVPISTPPYARTTPALVPILFQAVTSQTLFVWQLKNQACTLMKLDPIPFGRSSSGQHRGGILHITGVPEHTIKIIVKWRLDALIIYLQGQITTFTQGVVTAMVKVRWFKHITALPFSQL